MSKYPKLECQKCKSLVSSVSFKKHFDACDGTGVKYKKRVQDRLTKYEVDENGKGKCLQCGERFSLRGMSAHIRLVHEKTAFLTSKNGTWNKGKTKETDARIATAAEKLSQSMKGKNPFVWTDEQKLAQSLRKIKLYHEFPEKHPNRKLAGNRSKMTYPEQVCFDWLTKNNIEFEPQFPFNGWFIDFRIGSTLIEIDGEYWHRDKERDEYRNKVLSEHGFTVIRIKASERIEERLEQIFPGVA